MKKGLLIFFLILFLVVAFVYVKILNEESEGEKTAEIIQNQEVVSENKVVQKKIVKEPVVTINTDEIENKIGEDGVSKEMIDQMIIKIKDAYEIDANITLTKTELYKGSFLESFADEYLLKVRGYLNQGVEFYGIFDKDKKLKYFNTFEQYFTHGGVESHNYYCEKTGKNLILTIMEGCTNGKYCIDVVKLGSFTNNHFDVSQKKDYVDRMTTFGDQFEILQRIEGSGKNNIKIIRGGDLINVYEWHENSEISAEECKAPACVDYADNMSQAALMYVKTLKFNKESCLFE